ncbi:MAG: glycosyltransferase [Candidatus Paceibacterota bacterium]
MARKDLSQIDASESERYNLDYILKKEEKNKDDTKYVSVEEAVNEEALFQAKSDREETRVLFISRDESLLNPSKQSLDGYTNLSDLFDEVHILILREGIKSKTPVLRVADNVWLYTASSDDWWSTPNAGMKLVKEQLIFAEGFRPDLVVARDPFESAFLAIRIGKKFKCSVQVHVLEDYTKPVFLKKEKHNRWRRLLAKYTLSRVDSVRVITDGIYDCVNKNFKIKDLAILPKFNNYEPLISVKPTIDLKDKYRPFVFIMLYIGRLGHDSTLFRAIDAGRFGLRNPHIGLVVLGDGPARREFEKRAEILEIKKQVVFEPKVKDTIPYLKSASVLVITDTNAVGDELALKGAAAGIPMVISRTPAREDIFVDGESALLCEPDNTDEFSLKLNMIMNDVSLRRRLVESAQNMIRKHFHDDPEKYKTAYRNSVEKALIIDN